MPARPSEPILAWLRNTLKAKGLNVAVLAEASGERRAEVRRVLAEQAPLTVDQLITWTQAMGVRVEDLAGLSAQVPGPLVADEDTPAAEPPADEAPADEARPERPAPATLGLASARAPTPPAEPEAYTVDLDGGQAEQAIRLAFAMGVDFLFVANSAQLQDSGVPQSTLARFPDRLPIKLDAKYHRHNKPEYSARDITLTLSFDTLRVCQFPWSAIEQVTWYCEAPPPVAPPPPEPPPEEARPRPALRLVK